MENGLFIGLADEVIVGSKQGIIINEKQINNKVIMLRFCSINCIFSPKKYPMIMRIALQIPAPRAV